MTNDKKRDVQKTADEKRQDAKRASDILNRCAALIAENNERPLLQERLRKTFIDRPISITAEEAGKLYDTLIQIITE